MVVTPNGLKVTKLKLEATIISLWHKLLGHSLRLFVLEDTTLGIVVLPLDSSKPFIVHVILVLILVFSWIWENTHLDFSRRFRFLTRFIYLNHPWSKALSSIGWQIWLGVRSNLSWVVNISLCIDYSKKAIVPQRIIGVVALSTLERLLLRSVHLVPPAQELLRIEVLLDICFWAFFLFQELQASPRCGTLSQIININLFTLHNLKK